MDAADETHLRRAIRLAMNGRGTVEPNPMVGCVIVKDGRVVGEGYHARYGGPHAEPAALANCTESPAGATAYVTLEPCCHTDKQTPPCAPQLIAEKIARVVVGCLDPNPKVNGRGLRTLRDAGVPVDGPVLEAECKQLIAAFLERVNHDRPYVTVKWAESADGKVAGAGGRRVQISNAASSAQVQHLRARSDAIVVGATTVLTDDPLLLPRVAWHRRPGRPYMRAVLDTGVRTPSKSALVRTLTVDRPVRVYCGPDAFTVRATEIATLRDGGVRVRGLDAGPTGRLSLAAATWHLGSLGADHILIEPGPTLARGGFDENVADRLWVIRSPTTVGDVTAPRAAAVPDAYVPVGHVDLDGDVLTEYLNTRSPAFFAAVPSADFVLASGSPLSNGPEGRAGDADQRPTPGPPGRR